MSENVVKNKTLPQVDGEFADEKTLPNGSEVFVPVKFNKQIMNLNLEQAQELAQKGMKFDMISDDYLALKGLATAKGKNVGEYIKGLIESEKTRRLEEITEKCGGDSEFAEHILKLENGGDSPRGFEEIAESFPKIKAIEDLPQSVVEAASLKGTLLLDEYLRYLHKQEMAMKESLKKQKETLESSAGSFINRSGGITPETAEFLRGLWQK